MLAARVGRRLRALNLSDYAPYLELLRGRHGEDELVHLLDSVSTNVTSFFREAHHFEVLREIVGRWLAAGQGRFRFWSAGCSIGAEPYTMAMTVLEAVGDRPADVRILATDLSTKVLAQAQAGVYDEADLEPVALHLRERYFTWDREAGTFTANPELRRRILFRRLNLMEHPFPMTGPLDAVFCRNVMIYFDQRGRHNIIAEVRRLLRPGGYFMMGHSESLSADGGAGFVRVGASCYRTH
jgi:chemotaxis protein methyltransferase CheR